MSGATDEHDRGQRHEQLAAYTLGALDPAEAVELEAHLAGCESCRGHLRWLDPAVGALAASVPQLDPPRGLRRRTMAAARETGAAAADTRSLRRVGWLSPAAAAGAAAVIAFALGAGYLAGQGGGGASTVAAEVTAGVGGAEGQVVSDGDVATLEVADLPRLGRGDVYQAWLQRGDEIEPSTTFLVDRHGDGAVAVPGASGAEQLMVTREPRGGSEAPSTAPLVRAPLDST